MGHNICVTPAGNSLHWAEETLTQTSQMYTLHKQLSSDLHFKCVPNLEILMLISECNKGKDFLFGIINEIYFGIKLYKVYSPYFLHLSTSARLMVCCRPDYYNNLLSPTVASVVLCTVVAIWGQF